ncbi:MAG: hypothetical protein AABX89_03435 [Candidatus Thermoplasmatota archaeon]
MAADEVSGWAGASAIVALGLVAAAFALPWFSYEFSSGRQTAPGGFNDANETGVERHTLEVYPTHTTGDVQPTHPEDLRTATDRMTWALAAAIVLSALAALAELPGVRRLLVRRVVLGMDLLALVAIGISLAVAWYHIPATLDGYGVQDPFTSFVDRDAGYTRTTIGPGWVLAAAGGIAALVALAFKFQAGSSDAALVEELAAASRKS